MLRKLTKQTLARQAPEPPFLSLLSFLLRDLRQVVVLEDVNDVVLNFFMGNLVSVAVNQTNLLIWAPFESTPNGLVSKSCLIMRFTKAQLKADNHVDMLKCIPRAHHVHDLRMLCYGYRFTLTLTPSYLVLEYINVQFAGTTVGCVC